MSNIINNKRHIVTCLDDDFDVISLSNKNTNTTHDCDKLSILSNCTTHSHHTYISANIEKPYILNKKFKKIFKIKSCDDIPNNAIEKVLIRRYSLTINQNPIVEEQLNKKQKQEIFAQLKLFKLTREKFVIKNENTSDIQPNLQNGEVNEPHIIANETTLIKMSLIFSIGAMAYCLISK